MFRWLMSLFKTTTGPVDPPQELRTYTTSDPAITRDCIAIEGDTWRVECKEQNTIHLFELFNPNVEQCMITYRAKMKTENLTGPACLEMWCRLPGSGEFFSKGLNNTVKGTNDWASHEITFYLKKNRNPILSS